MTRLSRRAFCTGLTGALAGLGVGLSANTGGASTAEDTGEVDALVMTQGHFVVEDNEVLLADGVSETDYDIDGTIPGYHTDETPEEIVVGVHGTVDSEQSKVKSMYDTVAGNFQTAGYDGPFVGFTYDSADDFWEAVNEAWSKTNTKREMSRRNRYKLGAFLQEYTRRSPETKIRLVGHSGGGFVTLETLDHLYEENWDRQLESVVLLAAAVDDETAAVDGKYGPAIEQQATEVHSFYDPDDWVMTFGWNITNFDQSLGANVIQGMPPENLELHNVDEIKNHGAYFLPRSEGGAIEDVVAAF
jgi:hypothetical protein